METFPPNYLLTQLHFFDSNAQFIVNQYNKLDQYERRTRNVSHKINDQDQQITISFNLGAEALITHFVITFNDYKQFTELLQFMFAESISIGDPNQYKKMLNTSVKISNESYSFTLNALSYTKIFKLTFLLKQNLISNYLNLHQIKTEKTKNAFEQNINLLLKANLKKIEVWGYLPNISPPATHVPQLLNISHIFKKCSRQEEALQTDILLGLCLINARRFNQASQLLKKVSLSLVKKYEGSKNIQIMTSISGQNKKQISIQYQKKSKLKNDDSEIFYFNSTNCNNLLNNNKKSLLRAAKIQLLIADTINHPSMVAQKILAYKRATTFFTGTSFVDNNLKNFDIYTALLTLCPNLIRFLIKTLYDKFQPLKITAIKSLEFLLQSLGCSVGNYLPQLLKSIISTYPSLFQNNISYTPLNTPITIGIGYQQGSREKIINMGNNSKLVVDHYNHLLQSFLNLIGSLSKNISRVIFQQIILPNIFLPQISNEIRFYVFRISQKIINLCIGDLDIPISFLINLLNMTEGKGILFQKDKNNSPLIYHSQKIWELVKNKIILNFQSIKLIKIAEWVNQTMVFFCQNDLQNISRYSFQQILQIINIIYSKNTSQIIIYPLQPLLYFLNISINQNILEFQKILNSLIILLKAFLQKQKDYQIINQIIQKIVIKSTIGSLSLKQLRVFLQVLKLYNYAQTQWLLNFLNCIPHSTFDQTFLVFDLLLQLCKQKMEKTLLLKIINTLLDQYTVKGKAHKKTKQILTQIIIKDNKKQFLYFIQICIIDNKEPNTEGRQLNKIKLKKFDSKLYNKAIQLFTQKLTFVCQLFVSIKFHHLQFLLQEQNLIKFQNSLIQLLNSKNSKNRIKALNLVKTLIDCFQIYANQNHHIDQKTLKFSRSMLIILKVQIQQFKNSKIQFNALFLIYRVFSKIFKSTKTYNNQTQSAKNSINQNDLALLDLSKEQKYQVNDLNYLNMRIRQVLKLWPILITYITSPWAFIRQIFCIIIIQFFSVDLNYYKGCYKKKLLQLVKPILTNLLCSFQYTDRYYGLKMYATLIGMTMDFNSKSCLNIFRANSYNFPEHIQRIIQMQNDWDQNIKKCSATIVQLGLSKQLARSIQKRKNSEKRSINNLMSNSFFSFNIRQQFEQRDQSETLINLSENIQNFLRQTQNLMEGEIINLDYDDYIYEGQNEICEQNEQQESRIYWLQKQSWQKIKKYLQVFKRKDEEALLQWNEKNLNNQIINQQQDNFFVIHQQDIESFQKKQKNIPKQEQQQLDFEDLGIIEVDDQQWNDYESEVKMVQKLPLKRKYKLSPNLSNSNKIQMLQQSNKKLQIQQKQSILNKEQNKQGQIKGQSKIKVQQNEQQLIMKKGYKQQQQQQYEQFFSNQARLNKSKQIKKKKSLNNKKSVGLQTINKEDKKNNTTTSINKSRQQIKKKTNKSKKNTKLI